MEVTINKSVFLRRVVAFAYVECLPAFEAMGAEWVLPTVLGSVRGNGV